MVTIKNLLFVIVFLLVKKSFCQEIQWGDTRNWKLYDIHNKNAFNYNTDTLKSFQVVLLEDSTMQSIGSTAAVWPPEKYSLWMGFFLLSYETPGGQVRKLFISSYGGFFYDSIAKKYYQIPASRIAGLYLYLNDKAATFTEKK